MTSLNGAQYAGSSGKNRRKAVGVVLLTDEKLIINVDVKGKLYEVFNQVAAQLSLRETEYFGLALLKENEYQFLILDEKISKFAPKKWKSGPGEGLDADGKPLFTVCFRVQFYVDQVVLLREKVTRHLYYLQLKENVLKYDHLYNEEKCFQIVGYALQADHGNFIAEKHTPGYFDPRQYFPAWITEKRGGDYLIRNSPLVHHDLHNMTRTDAELKYVRECSTAPGAHNLHFYRVRKKKADKACNTWLAICPRGVEVYEDDAGFKNLISTFLWPDIGRLVFDKKKFEIRSVGSAGGRKFAYYTDSDVTSKYLLHICRSTHIFQMAIQPKLMEIRHLDAEDKKRYRESYIYSDVRDLHANSTGPIQYRSCSKSPGKSPSGTQRFSVISDASSNTTSGIVSDKMAISFDEEEPGKEIIIDCPPRGSIQGTMGHQHPKLPIRGSYKMTPPTPGSRSPALPPQSLELFRLPGSSNKGSPSTPHLPELSPASSTGSYRAKLQQTSHGLYSGKPYPFANPSPSSPGQTFSLAPAGSGNPSPSSPREREMPMSLARSASNKENFSKGVAGLLMHMERNLSGDSTATSGSTASAGLVSLSVENSPVTQPANLGGVGQYSAAGALVSSGGNSASFSYSPASFTCQQQQSCAGNALGGMSPFMYHQGLLEQQPVPHVGMAGSMLPSMMMRLGLASSAATPVMHGNSHLGSSASPAPHHQVLLPASREQHLYTDRTKETELRSRQQEEAATAAVLREAVLAPPPAFADSASAAELKGHGQGLPSLSSQSSSAFSSGSSYTQGGRDSVDSGHVLSDESPCSTAHSAQSSEEDSGLKEASKTGASISSCKNATPVKIRNTPAKVKAGGRGKGTHVSVKNQKEALHPDIEQILLGQSQAHSLPLITALCNDLMTGSAHSSTGSYDTSTLRSAESSQDTRRWSACGPMETSVDSAGSCGTMLVVSGAGSAFGVQRPYSWHCEDAALSILTPHPLAPHKKPVPSSQLPLLLQQHHHHHHHHQLQQGLQQQQENAHSLPHDLCRAVASRSHTSAVLWTQAVGVGNSEVDSSPYGGSLERYSSELIAQQLMIPSRLNSGGRTVGLADNGHKMMKENIGIA